MLDPDYELFLQIVTAGSISAAARGRGLSTPALSKRLARLESRLGVRLLHRTTRRLELTRAGKDLHDTLLPLRTALLAAEERIAGRGDRIAGSIRLAAPTSFGRMHVVPWLPSFMDRYPEIDMAIDLSDDFVDLLAGRHDLAIRICAEVGPGLVGYRFGTSRRVLCAAPAYLARWGEPASLADLAQHRVLAAESQLPWQLWGPGGECMFNGRSVIQTNSSEVVRELALSGCGIALRSLWDVSAALADGSLRRVLPAYQGSQNVGIFALHAPAPIVPARVRLLIDHLQANLGPFDHEP